LGPLHKPLFVLGVGAQKAGTSFLYKLLQSADQVRLSELKEMHVFDRAFLPAAVVQEWSRMPRLSMFRQALRQEATAWRRSLPNPARMAGNFEKYVMYFRRLSEGVAATGEITPSYAMLEADHFRQIRDLLSPHFDMRIIFFMRDPIDRMFSQMKMHQTLGTIPSAEIAFARDFSRPFVERRTRYENTIRALEGAFPKEQIHYGLYESFFLEKNTGALKEFLGLEIPDTKFGTRVNASYEGRIANTDDIARVRSYFDETYRFCAARFGDGVLKKYWKYY